MVCLQFLLLPFHPLIHSGRMTWMISFTFQVQATQVFLDILLDPSVSSLADRTACHGKSSLLRGRSRTHDTCNPPTSGLAVFPLPSLPPRAIVYHHRILRAIEHPYQSMYASSRRWPGTNSVLDHPHLRHNPRASSSLIGVHCCPFHCLPRWMLPIPVLPQSGAFLYRDP